MYAISTAHEPTDNFRVHSLMVLTRDYIVSLRDNKMNSAERVLTKNHTLVIQFYLKEIESFCDGLADSGMHKRMVNSMTSPYRLKIKERLAYNDLCLWYSTGVVHASKDFAWKDQK
jgi:hypothetical protein